MPISPIRQLPRKTACVLAIAVLASACTKSEPKPVVKPEPITFKAQAPIPVTFTLLKKEAEGGRSSPIGAGYRPQVRFDLDAIETSCTVQLPVDTPSLAPGQSAKADLVCVADVRVEQTKPEFAAFEGGKRIGQGAVRLP